MSFICRYLSSAVSLICRHLSSAISLICRYFCSVVSFICCYLFTERFYTKVALPEKEKKSMVSDGVSTRTTSLKKKRTRCCSVISSICCHIFTARFHTIQSIAAPENTVKNLHELMSCRPFFPLWRPSLSRFTRFE